MHCPSCGTDNPDQATFCMACATRLAPPPESQVKPVQSQETSIDFVGRLREMDQLRSALNDALSGNGRLIMLAGEAGIGKTRTAQELCNLAKARGFQILWGQCYEREGAPAYWPWAQAFRNALEQMDPAQTGDDLGDGVLDIAAILPSLGQRNLDKEAPSTLEPEQARFRLFNSITTFFKNASAKQPILLVLDDLHWADNASLLLLEFIVQELPTFPMLILGTYRDVELNRQHPLAETLGELTRGSRLQRIPLRGLNQDEVIRFLEITSHIVPLTQLSTSVHHQTEGNPLFLTEIVRLMVQEGQLRQGQELRSFPSGMRIPEGVREVIGRRLNRLSDDCNEILRMASIIGREFQLRHLLLLAEDASEERMIEVLEQALTARVIDELPLAIGNYQFSHALIRETLIEEIPVNRRVRLHAQIAEALERSYGGEASDHAAELAYHFGQADAVLGPDKSVQYSLLAGEKALAAFAWDEAQNHFERGLTARGISAAGSDPLPDAQAAALAFGLGRALIGTATVGKMQEPVDALSRAFDFYYEKLDSANAIAVAQCHVPAGNARTGMKRIIELALNLVPEGSLTEGRLLTHYGFELGRIDGDYASAQAEFNRALSVARKAENAPLELSILTNSADVDLYHGKLEDCATKNLNAIAQAVRANDAYNEAFARMNYIRALILQGDGREARRQMAHFRTVGERMRDRYWLAGALYDDSWLSCLEGDWQTGSNLAEAALDLSSRHSNAIVSLVMAEYETGNFGQGELYLERLLEVMSLTSPRAQSSHSWPAIVIPYAGLISGVPVRLKEATEAAQIVLSSPSGALLYNVMARSGLGLQAVILDDPDAAAEQYRNLQSIQGRLVPFFWSGDWILALLARTMGNWERAVQHFEDSLLFCQKAGYRPQLARASAYFGETLMQRNLPGDIEKAESLLNEATTLSNELGMQPLMDWIQSCEKKLKDLPSGASDHLYGLTERELQVLRLIVSGKSNAEIAEELIISVRTVANHVANILTKTSTSNRVEAATLATRNHLD